VIFRAMAKDRNQRQSTCEELLGELCAALYGASNVNKIKEAAPEKIPSPTLPVDPKPTPSAPAEVKPRHLSSGLVITLVLLLIVSVGIRFLWQQAKSPTSLTGASSLAAGMSMQPDQVLGKLVGEFVYIPDGEFIMGSTNGDSNEKPAHRVKISSAFEMGKYEVTQAQWEAVMGSNPSNFKEADLPVENVSWEDVQKFIQALNSRSKKYNYRLPTEAEWEYACRAGTMGDYAGDLDSMAWYGSNSGGNLHPVGKKQPNGWGLYDMHGNVWEWCQDWFGAYRSDYQTDPKGPSTGSNRVGKGGSWDGNARVCRSGSRGDGAPDYRDGYLGFRLLRTPR
jgi:formylglycine-generating enzyme required for sulfatase activity